MSRIEADTGHTEATKIYHARLAADARAKKAYEVAREQKKHNKWLTAVRADK